MIKIGIKPSEEINKFLKYMELIQSASPLTLKSYRVDLTQAFVPTLNKKSKFDEELSEEQLLFTARKALNGWGGLSPATRNRKAASIKSFFRFLFQEKLIKRPLGDLIHAPKVPKKMPHFISVDEALAVLKQSQGPSRLLFLLLYGGGLRISEACHLKWSQVDFYQKNLRVQGKGQKERVVPLPSIVLGELETESRKNIHSERSGKSYIWGESPLNARKGYEMIRRLGAKSSLLSSLHPHALRHSFATHLLSSGANLRALQEILGHSNLAATEKYTHLSVDQLARTMEKAHPLGNLTNSPSPTSKPSNK